MTTTAKLSKWQALYQRILANKDKAEEKAKKILRMVVQENITRQNPVLGFKKPTPFRKWLFDVLRDANENNSYLEIGGWVLYQGITLKSSFSFPPLPIPKKHGWRKIDFKKNYDLSYLLYKKIAPSTDTPAGWLDRFALSYLYHFVYDYDPINEDYDLIAAAAETIAQRPEISIIPKDEYSRINLTEKNRYELIFILTQTPNFYEIIAELLTPDDSPEEN